MFPTSQPSATLATDFSSLAMALDQITCSLNELQGLIEDISEPVLFEQAKKPVAGIKRQWMEDDQLEEWLEMAEEEHLLSLSSPSNDASDAVEEMEPLVVQSSYASVPGEQPGK